MCSHLPNNSAPDLIIFSKYCHLLKTFINFYQFGDYPEKSKQEIRNLTILSRILEAIVVLINLRLEDILRMVRVDNFLYIGHNRTPLLFLRAL